MILLCTCTCSKVVPPAKTSRVLAALEAAGVPVRVVPDLCGLAAECDPLLAELAAAPSACVIACHPRAVRWLLSRGGCNPSSSPIRFLDLRAQTPEEILPSVLPPPSPPSPSPSLASSSPSLPSPSPWTPWFPVIDYSRCTQCRQCLNFCLFGVYAAGDSGRVEVRNPRNCKNNCPACARVCPDAAIIFPKCPEAPINGDEIRDEQAVRAAARASLEKILGDNPYAALAARRARARRLLADDPSPAPEAPAP